MILSRYDVVLKSYVSAYGPDIILILLSILLCLLAVSPRPRKSSMADKCSCCLGVSFVTVVSIFSIASPLLIVLLSRYKFLFSLASINKKQTPAAINNLFGFHDLKTKSINP